MLWEDTFGLSCRIYGKREVGGQNRGGWGKVWQKVILVRDGLQGSKILILKKGNPEIPRLLFKENLLGKGRPDVKLQFSSPKCFSAMDGDPSLSATVPPHCSVWVGMRYG